jgi:hypothetical protein
MPRIVGCLTALPAETAVLDAELVAGDGGFWTTPRAIAEEHVAIAAFDLLRLGRCRPPAGAADQPQGQAGRPGAPGVAPLRFESGGRWYSEARLGSPFKPRWRGDPLGEAYTNADGVVGHFEFRPETETGLTISSDATQFVVIEAKMFSGLSAGTKNAPTYNQAARNVACMAQAIAQSGRRLDDFTSLAFFVVAPTRARRPPSRNGIEQFLEPKSIKSAVRDRIAAYETGNRTEATDLKAWEQHWFLPLVDRLADTGALRLLAWEDCIEAVTSAQPGAGADLSAFYDRCLALARAVTTITSD